MSALSYLDSVILGVVEGLTEYLPVSSTGHLTVAEKLLGYNIDDPAITSFTAIIQIGAIIATLLYFRRPIAAMVTGFFAGLRNPARRDEPDFRLGVAVIIGSIPVVVAALLFKPLITGPLRSLWVVAAALILWSGVIWAAEKYHDKLAARGETKVGENEVTYMDALVIGLMQCVSVIPGVSRSGSTISGGLFRGIDRVTATNLSFYMAIPALVGAGVYELKDVNTAVVGWGQIGVGTAVSFVVAYASIAWLLQIVKRHGLVPFIGYRVLAGAGLLVALAAGWISAT